MRNNYKIALLFTCFVYFSTAFAANEDSISIVKRAKAKSLRQKNELPKLLLRLDLMDLPYQVDASRTANNGEPTFSGYVKGYASPSMHQSLELTTSLYSGWHYGIDKVFGKDSYRDWSKSRRFWHSITLLLGDYFLMTAPGFDGWLHEEYHRAVMTRFGVNSFNDMNKFPIGAETVSVSHVADEDLVRFKQESPSDFIRMHVAGIEGEYLLAEKLQQNNFFYNQNLSNKATYLLSILNAVAYVNISSDSKYADNLTDLMNARENTLSVRDFTGLDFTGWTYDLFRPGEPYTTRGTHPSGLGIDRYIKTSDLTDAELRYLKKQGSLQLLNLVSPMLFGYDIIQLNRGSYGNFAIRNYLTSFGNDASVNVFLKNKGNNYAITLHNYMNYKHYFPAAELEILDKVLPIGGEAIYFTPRALIGVQPLQQSFYTNKASLLGFMECRLEFKTKLNLNPYMEFSAKTKGWVAGNEFLNSNFSVRVGASMRFYE